MSNLSFSLIQADLVWEDQQANLENLEKKIREIPNGGQIVVLPEMFSTGFSMSPEKSGEDMNGRTIEWMKKLAAEKKLIITGSFIASEDDKFYNRLVWMLPSGEYGKYDKRHLFAFAGEHEHYTAGKKRMIASVNGWKINLLVCYDLRFPVWARQQYAADGSFEYDVLIYVANWPERRIHAWKTLLQARAIENQCYVIGLNRVGKDGNDIVYSGDSMVVDPLGEVIAHAGAGEKVISVILERNHLDTVREKFQFWRDADRFYIEGF